MHRVDPEPRLSIHILLENVEMYLHNHADHDEFRKEVSEVRAELGSRMMEDIFNE